MSRAGLLGAAIAVLVLLIVLNSAVFTVQQAEQALVLRFGAVVRQVDQPGLHFKLPIVENVAYFDKRLLDFDAESQRVPTTDQKPLLVDAFARYRIVNPLRFFQLANNERGFEERFRVIINSAVQNEISKVPLLTMLTPERAAVIKQITEIVRSNAENYGVAVVDVRLKTVNFPRELISSVVSRMQTQRGQEARKIRAEGDKESRRIHADADLQERVIIAEARKQAEITEGLGDAEAQRIYNEAYGKDVKFFDFWRSMQAMTVALPKDTTTYVGGANNDFFRYFGSETGAGDTKAVAKP
ncbi:MAG TPA: protease modulator HflC [Alphaproteobacteria bacterium]